MNKTYCFSARIYVSAKDEDEAWKIFGKENLNYISWDGEEEEEWE